MVTLMEVVVVVGGLEILAKSLIEIRRSLGGLIITVSSPSCVVVTLG